MRLHTVAAGLSGHFERRMDECWNVRKIMEEIRNRKRMNLYVCVSDTD